MFCKSRKGTFLFVVKCLKASYVGCCWMWRFFLLLPMRFLFSGFSFDLSPAVILKAACVLWCGFAYLKIKEENMCDTWFCVISFSSLPKDFVSTFSRKFCFLLDMKYCLGFYCCCRWKFSPHRMSVFSVLSPIQEMRRWCGASFLRQIPQQYSFSVDIQFRETIFFREHRISAARIYLFQC